MGTGRCTGAGLWQTGKKVYGSVSLFLWKRAGKLCDDASRLVHRMASMDRDVTPGQERDSA